MVDLKDHEIAWLQKTSAMAGGSGSTPPTLAPASAPAASAPPPASAPAETLTGDGVTPPNSPQNTSGGSSLVGNAVVQALANKMDEDGAAADSQWKSQTTNDVFNFLSPEVHTEYDADGSSCDEARGDFNAAWNKVFRGQGSPENLLTAWNIYSLRIAALQLSNARIQGFITIKAAQQLAAFGSFVGELAREVLELDLTSRLESLKTAIVDAQTRVHKAEAKLALNAGLTAFTTVFAPEATLSRIALGVGGFVGHILINKGLGDGTANGLVVVQVGSDVKTAVGVATPFVSQVKVYGVTGKQALGGLRGAIDAALDGLELYEDIKILKDLKSQAEATQTEFDRVMAGLTPLAEKFQVQEAALQQLNGLVAQAVQQANSALQDYTELQRQIEQAIKSGS